ncbi:MAG: phosphoribosylformylglycinamidine synthase I [Bradymonadaceae bacterium]
MRIGIVVFPGSNCDRDCYHVVERVLDEDAVWIWHRDGELPDVDAVLLPGGFSYGDYLRTGAIAKMSPVMEAVGNFAGRGGPVVGICNGFQVLLECGMLPGAMIRNDSLKFVCRDAHIRCINEQTAVTARLDIGDIVEIPVAHAEGNYYIDDEGLEELFERDQVVFQYCDAGGEIAPEANPNGSVRNVAGICNEAGNVVGMMPHPERASEPVLGNDDGLRLLESAIEFAS